MGLARFIKSNRYRLSVRILIKTFDRLYDATVYLLLPLNMLIGRMWAPAAKSDSVLHISNMIHIPHNTVRVLRRCGMAADYLAIGSSEYWNRCDFQLRPSLVPMVRVLQEMWVLWRIVVKYEVIHCHFMITLSKTGWELPLLKRMGRKVVVNFRGCDIRSRELNMRMHPDMNICQRCDYAPHYPCQSAEVLHRRRLAEKYGDLVLVTTPDLQDFVRDSIHFTFFCPEELINTQPLSFKNTIERSRWPFRIFHTTTHPGIEGTLEIQDTIDRLRRKGYDIEFVFLTGVPFESVLEECAKADVSIGKMKMGYYANSQIESMLLGVPSITYVRPQFITADFKDSGFIIASLNELEATLEHYMKHPDELDELRRKARLSALRLHDNDMLGKKLRGLYRDLLAEGT